MLKFGDMTTTIRIQTKTVSISESGFSTEGWADLIDDDLPCEWRNKFGSESWRQEYVHARDPATVRLWYLQGVDATCRLIRDDGAIFEIVNVDDVENRHMQLELEVRRYTGG